MPVPLPPFTIQQPATLAEASRMLVAGGEDARPYAGGTELLLVMKHGGLRYDRLVDVKTIPGLDTIEVRSVSTGQDSPPGGESGGALWIGAAVTHLMLERSPLVRHHLPSLADLEAKVANPRVRAAGTLAGNLCFAEPHSDPATLLLALDASVQLAGPDGERDLLLADFLLGPYETALAEGELLTAVTIPIPRAGWRAEYRKFQVRERPMLGLALALELDEAAEHVLNARVAVGSVSPKPRCVPVSGDLLTGPFLDAAQHLDAATAAIVEAAELVDDLDGSAEYKAHLIGVFLRQSFARLTSRYDSA
jgi:carbon-monoxide dehydrogenase medium subunit